MCSCLQALQAGTGCVACGLLLVLALLLLHDLLVEGVIQALLMVVHSFLNVLTMSQWGLVMVVALLIGDLLSESWGMAGGTPPAARHAPTAAVPAPAAAA